VGKRYLGQLLVAGEVGLLALVAALGPLRDHRGWILAALVTAGILWWLAVESASARPLPWLAVVAGAVALRAPMLLASPEVSDDLHRYVWEGELARRGISPYAFAPASPELRQLPEFEEIRRALPDTAERVNHPEVSAAYPPLTIGVCTAVMAVANAPRPQGGLSTEEWARTLFRWLFALCDLLVLWPLRSLLARTGRSPSLAIAWAWSPLVALEFAGSGHFDSLAILLWVGALALQREEVRESGARAGVVAPLVLACSVLLKYLPACSLPFLLRGRGWVRRTLAVAALVAAAYGSIALLRGGTRGLFDGLSAYGLRWESMSLIYRFVEGAASSFLARDLRLLDARPDARLVGRALVAAVWIATLGILLVRRASSLRAAAVLTAAFLLLTPTLHPWYLTWVLPFVALRAASPRPWLYLCVVAPLFYWPIPAWQSAGVWEEPNWLWPVAALPFFLLGLQTWRARHRGALAELA
jgi:hypothetical protein